MPTCEAPFDTVYPVGMREVRLGHGYSAGEVRGWLYQLPELRGELGTTGSEHLRALIDLLGEAHAVSDAKPYRVMFQVERP
jgi:hypothetical protein